MLLAVRCLDHHIYNNYRFLKNPAWWPTLCLGYFRDLCRLLALSSIWAPSLARSAAIRRNACTAREPSGRARSFPQPRRRLAARRHISWSEAGYKSSLRIPTCCNVCYQLGAGAAASSSSLWLWLSSAGKAQTAKIAASHPPALSHPLLRESEEEASYGLCSTSASWLELEEGVGGSA